MEPGGVRMKQFICITTIYFCLSLTAWAQTPDASKGQIYVFAGAAHTHARAIGHVGFGGDGRVYKRLAIGAELGAIGPWSDFTDSAGGLGSVILSYYVLPPISEGKLEPFVNAGYDLFFRAGVRSGGNLGAGVNVWLAKTVGLRPELRYHTFTYNRFVELRVGLASR
jgi:hypothetical protein